jgi:hypothetical protein
MIPAKVLTVAEMVKLNPNIRGEAHAASGETELIRAYHQLQAWVTDTLRSFVDETGRARLVPQVSTLMTGATRADITIS